MTVQCVQPRKGYLCVGGPLDGQWRVEGDGVREFHVVEHPPIRLSERFDLDGPVTARIKSHRYVLTRTDDGGLIWQLS